MTVLLTGATGFIGSHIAEALVQQGRQVRCLLRASSSPRYLPAGVEQRVAALDDDRGLVQALRSSDTVIHLAGVTRVRHALEYFRVNVTGTAALARAAERSGVRRFILISSLAARGPDGISAPVSLYGASKLAAEQVLQGYSGAFEVVILRPAGVYGPRDQDFLPLFQLARRGFSVASSSNSALQLLHAADLAQACLRALDSAVPQIPLPLASPEVIYQRMLAQFLERIVGRRVRQLILPPSVFELAGLSVESLSRLVGQAPRFDRRRARDIARYSYTCETNPAAQALGWSATLGLQDGLRQTYDWYLKAGWL